MDLLTLNRIKYLHPRIRQEALEAYMHVNNKLLGKNVRLRFTHTLRSFSEQATLYSYGRNKPGKKVTNAGPGQSMHNYGLAFDIVLLIDRNNDGIFETASWEIGSDFDNDEIADWMEVVQYLKSMGWIWGGHWKSFPDYPHFEKTLGYNWKTLLKKHSMGDVFNETIEGVVYKWVNL